MKKILLIIPIVFSILFCAVSVNAQSISEIGASDARLEIETGRESYNPNNADKKAPVCWECSLVEGVYTYTFNFVFKMYHILCDNVFSVVLVFLLFWFLWLVWSQVIKKQEGDIFSLLKTVFIKIFAITFVGAMLKVAPNELFSYTIDPIMNLGTGFAKWILVETRNDNDILQNDKLPKFDCKDIQLSKNTLEMFRNNSIDTEDESNTETLKNLICLTREYSNTYNTGLSLGFRIASNGFINYVAAKVWDTGVGWGRSFVGLFNWGPAEWARIIVIIVLIIIQIVLFLDMFASILCVIGGLGIGIAFFYVAFTYLCLVIDIVIHLALIGLMMPIGIGAWAFNDNGYMNLRSKLSQRLFGGVLKCACRLTFLAISISISTFLLTELTTTQFDMPSKRKSIQTLLKELPAGNSFSNHWEFNSFDFLTNVLAYPGLIVAILIVTLISWSLLTESIAMADKICGSLPLYNWVGDDKIFNGLKKITLSTIKTITQVPVRTVLGYKKYAATKDALRKKVADEVKDAKQAERNSTIKKWEDEVFNEGKPDHLYDLPPETIINKFEEQQDILQDNIFPQPEDFYDNASSQSTSSGIGPVSPFGPAPSPISGSGAPNGLGPIPASGYKRPTRFVYSPDYIQIQNSITATDKEIERTIKPQRDFVTDKFKNIDEYKNLSQEKKDKLVSVLFETGPNANANITEISNDTDIAKLVNVIQRDTDSIFPMTTKNVGEKYQTPLHQMKEEYIRQEILNQIAKDGTSPDKITKKQADRSALIAFVADGKNRNDAKMQKYFDTFRDRVEIDLSKKKKKLDDLNVSNKRKKSINIIINTKTVVLSIKNAELRELQDDIDSLDITDPPAKIFMLRRKIKKLKNEIDGLAEKSPYEIDEEYAGIIDDYKNNKKRRRPKINPNMQS